MLLWWYVEVVGYNSLGFGWGLGGGGKGRVDNSNLVIFCFMR